MNKENYEAYFLDYIEGNLSQKDIDMLLVFLEKYPELKEELADYGDVSLVAPDSNLDHKYLIQIDLVNDIVNASNLETFAIADFENELSLSKSNELSKFVNSSVNHKKEVDLVNSTGLTFDGSIAYPGKGELKKTVPLFIPYYRMAGIAAILLLMLYFVIPNNGIESDNPELATNEINTSSLVALKNTDNINVIENCEGEESENCDPQPSISIEPLLFTNSKSVIVNPKDKNIEVINKMKLRKLQTLNIYSSNRALASYIPITKVEDYYDNSKSDYTDKNKYLSPKEFLASVFKKDVLKSKSEGTEIKTEDFNNTLANITNDKISFKKSANNTRLISIQTKNFSFEKKLKNQL